VEGRVGTNEIVANAVQFELERRNIMPSLQCNIIRGSLASVQLTPLAIG